MRLRPARIAGPAIVLSALLAATAAPLASAGVDRPQWQQALQARGAALNARYGLGTSAAAATAASRPAWQRALELRGQALDRRYRLGRYAPAPSTGSGFAWADAGIGAACATAVCVMLASLFLGVRGRLRLPTLP